MSTSGLPESVRNQLPTDLSWVDHAVRGPVTAIETPQAVKQDLLYQLYWNTSVQREVLLGSANATDAFSAPHLRIAANGALENVHGDVLFHDYGATGVFANARQVASKVRFTLWQTQRCAATALRDHGSLLGRLARRIGPAAGLAPRRERGQALVPAGPAERLASAASLVTIGGPPSPFAW